jgi:glycosyltransferase involved in cell wall biosynthesis
MTGSGAFDLPASARGAVLDAGFLSEPEKRDAMAGALAFVHPSLNESLGIVLLESWMAGTPALVHAAGRVLVHQCRASGGGLWFGSYPEFEECVNLLMDRPELRSSLGRRGRDYVLDRHAWNAVEQRLETALRR